MTEVPPDTQAPRPGPFWTVVESAMILAFIAMLAVMFVQVTSRYGLGVGVPWTDETSRYLFVAQIFLGGAIAERYRAHIRITIVLDLLSERAQLFAEVLGRMLVLLIAIALLVGCFHMMVSNFSVAASTIPITMAWVYGVQALGIALYGFLVLRDLIGRLALLSGRGARA